MKTSRTLSPVGAMLLLTLLAPLAAHARPPQPAGPFAPWPTFSAPPPSIVGPHLVVTKLTSAPTRARAGHGYVLQVW